METALMMRMGLIRSDDEGDRRGGGRRRHQQPMSHENALPPGLIDPDAGRQPRMARDAKAGAPFLVGDASGNGLLVSGGLPNGHTQDERGGMSGRVHKRESQRGSERGSVITSTWRRVV